MGNMANMQFKGGVLLLFAVIVYTEAVSMLLDDAVANIEMGSPVDIRLERSSGDFRISALNTQDIIFATNSVDRGRLLSDGNFLLLESGTASTTDAMEIRRSTKDNIVRVSNTGNFQSLLMVENSATGSSVPASVKSSVLSSTSTGGSSLVAENSGTGQATVQALQKHATSGVVATVAATVQSASSTSSQAIVKAENLGSGEAKLVIQSGKPTITSARQSITFLNAFADGVNPRWILVNDDGAANTNDLLLKKGDGAEVLKVTQAGRFQTSSATTWFPGQIHRESFFAKGTPSVTSGISTTVFRRVEFPTGTQVLNVGGNYATGVFTASVAGIYRVCFTIRLNGLTGGSPPPFARSQLLKNTVEHGQWDVGGLPTPTISVCTFVDLAATDTIELMVMASGGTPTFYSTSNSHSMVIEYLYPTA